jgi:hypothetical protein
LARTRISLIWPGPAIVRRGAAVIESVYVALLQAHAFYHEKRSFAAVAALAPTTKAVTWPGWHLLQTVWGGSYKPQVIFATIRFHNDSIA